MAVRAAVPDDLWDIARIHKARFSEPEYLLGQFSVTVVRGFYAALLERAVLLVHVSAGGIDGFVLGGASEVLRECKQSFIRANAVRCALEALVRPRIWGVSLRAVGNLLLPSRKSAGDESGRAKMRLLGLAITAGTAGGGAAMSLIEAFEERIRGACTVYEGTVHKTNVHLLRFYDLVGFRQVADNGREVVVRMSLIRPDSNE